MIPAMLYMHVHDCRCVCVMSGRNACTGSLPQTCTATSVMYCCAKSVLRPWTSCIGTNCGATHRNAACAATKGREGGWQALGTAAKWVSLQVARCPAQQASKQAKVGCTMRVSSIYHCCYPFMANKPGRNYHLQIAAAMHHHSNRTNISATLPQIQCPMNTQHWSGTSPRSVPGTPGQQLC
jgi:hypothetical protein